MSTIFLRSLFTIFFLLAVLARSIQILFKHLTHFYFFFRSLYPKRSNNNSLHLAWLQILFWMNTLSDLEFVEMSIRAVFFSV